MENKSILPTIGIICYLMLSIIDKFIISRVSKMKIWIAEDSGRD